MAASTSPGRRRTSPGSGSEGDGRDQAAVIRLAPVGGAAVAEEAVRIRIGAEPEIREGADAGRFHAGPDQGRQVEEGMTLLAARAEEALVSRVRLQETRQEFGADFVGLAGDHG